jgi:hypothetical protein
MNATLPEVLDEFWAVVVHEYHDGGKRPLRLPRVPDHAGHTRQTPGGAARCPTSEGLPSEEMLDTGE